MLELKPLHIKTVSRGLLLSLNLLLHLSGHKRTPSVGWVRRGPTDRRGCTRGGWGHTVCWMLNEPRTTQPCLGYTSRKDSPWGRAGEVHAVAAGSQLPGKEHLVRVWAEMTAHREEGASQPGEVLCTWAAVLQQHFSPGPWSSWWPGSRAWTAGGVWWVERSHLPSGGH